jgi:hypothetical protein
MNDTLGASIAISLVEAQPLAIEMAEREGFEPSRRVNPVYRISSAAPSTN